MNLKRLTVQSKWLFNLATWAKPCSWPMRNNIYCWERVISCSLCSRRALVTSALFQAPSSFTMFFCKSSFKKYRTGAFYCSHWTCSNSIPTDAQYVTLQKKFSSPNIVIYIFAIPPTRLKRGMHIGGNYW
jgi:hypothetical protein